MINSALIVEDHNLMQNIFASILDQAYPGITVTIENTVDSGMQQVATSVFDIALIDLSLPDGSGVDIIRQLKSIQKQCCVVVITIFDDDDHLFSALEAGADGYLLKDAHQEKLVTALKGICIGEPALSPSIAQRLIRKFNNPPPQPQESILSKREEAVLTLIAKGYKRADAATALDISENTVAAHIKSIYKKLGISSRAEASLAATRLGYIAPV